MGVFSKQKARKRPLFSETLAGISILTQWTPCHCNRDIVMKCWWGAANQLNVEGLYKQSKTRIVLNL